MSQYRAYFVPGGVDPRGLNVLPTDISMISIPEPEPKPTECFNFEVIIQEFELDDRGLGLNQAESRKLNALAMYFALLQLSGRPAAQGGGCGDEICCITSKTTTGTEMEIVVIYADEDGKKHVALTPHNKKPKVAVVMHSGHCQSKGCPCPKVPIVDEKVERIKSSRLVIRTNFMDLQLIEPFPNSEPGVETEMFPLEIPLR